MATLDIQIEKKKALVKIDLARLEKILSALGFFSDEFLESIKRAEKDIKKGRIKKIKSLREFR